MHDILGLLCLLGYALLPFYLLARLLHHRFGYDRERTPSEATVSLRGALLLSYLLLLLLAGSGVRLLSEKPTVAEQGTLAFAGFESERMANGVTKYSNNAALVYLKPVKAFYSTEHHPLVCWEGSGYKFRHVQQRQLGSHQVYLGELQKGSETLYTVWWMDNGRHRTIDQWEWRWRMLKGEEKFSLINVTVAHKEELAQAVQAVMEQSQLAVR